MTIKIGCATTYKMCEKRNCAKAKQRIAWHGIDKDEHDDRNQNVRERERKRNK